MGKPNEAGGPSVLHCQKLPDVYIVDTNHHVAELACTALSFVALLDRLELGRVKVQLARYTGNFHVRRTMCDPQNKVLDSISVSGENVGGYSGETEALSEPLWPPASLTNHLKLRLERLKGP